MNRREFLTSLAAAPVGARVLSQAPSAAQAVTRPSATSGLDAQWTCT